MKKIVSLILAISIILSMSACSEEKNSASTDSSLESTQTSNDTSKEEKNTAIREKFLVKASEVAVSDDKISFSDDSGRGVITIDKNPKKVAVLYGSLACLWYEAGGDIQGIVGGKSAEALYNEQLGEDISKKEGATVLATTSSAKSWDLEQIIAFNPDLIICSTAMNAYSLLAPVAQAANIPVVAISYSGAEDYFKWFRVFTALNSKENLWTDIADKTLNEIAEVVAKVPPKSEKSPKVLSFQSMSEKASQANSGRSDNGVMLNDLNAINIADMNNTAASAKVDIDLEYVYSQDPDIILVQCMASVDKAKEQVNAEFADNPVWNNLKAVKDNKVYFLPNHLFHNKANSQYGEAYKMLAEILYPDIEF